jgi:hypothetical protein
VWNGLIQFTLFLMGKFNSKVKQLESRTVSWNGLCSKFEVPLYVHFCIQWTLEYFLTGVNYEVHHYIPHTSWHCGWGGIQRKKVLKKHILVLSCICHHK